MVANGISTLLLLAVTWLSVVAIAQPAATLTESAPSGDGLSTEGHEEADGPLRLDLGLNPRLPQDQNPLHNADLTKGVADPELASDVSFLPNYASGKKLSPFETDVDGKLKITSDSESTVREVRQDAAAAHAIGGAASRCQRHSLYVNFTALGWDGGIIAPQGFDAYYCAGECKYPLRSNETTSTHVWIQSAVHANNPSLVPTPCCAPTVLGDMSAIVLENEKPVYRVYKDMVVRQCGCR